MHVKRIAQASLKIQDEEIAELDQSKAKLLKQSPQQVLITHKNAEVNHTSRSDLRRPRSPQINVKLNESKQEECRAIKVEVASGVE